MTEIIRSIDDELAQWSNVTFWRDSKHELAICCMSEFHIKSEEDMFRIFPHAERIREEDFKVLHDSGSWEVVTVADDNIMNYLNEAER